MTRSPENTAPAIERSIGDIVEWVEVDVRLTKDGKHVLFHDDVLDRRTDGTGRVRDRTLDEIKRLDAGEPFARRFAGERILTLEEGLKLARDRINVYLDCKEIDPVELVRAIWSAKMERQVVLYGDIKTLEAIRKVGGERLPLMAKWRPRFGLDGRFENLRLAAVEIDAADVSPDVCKNFHQRGIKVQAKTLGEVDDRPEVWDRMEAAGVDWVQTDRAEEVVARTIAKSLRTRRVKIAHHRGASQYAPENTLPALNKAIALGADFVEFDVRTTRDRAFVLLHDGALNRTTDGQGPIQEKSLDELRKLDAGAWFGRPFARTKMPTLDEFLDAANRKVELYVDAKSIVPEALAESLRRHGLAEQAVVYQSAAYLERLKTIAPEIRRMPPLGKPEDLDVLADRVKPYAFDTRWSILSKSLIDRCHAKGIKVFSDALGFNETIGQYQKAIADGIDTIQTDHPLRVLRTLELLERTP